MHGGGRYLSEAYHHANQAVGEVKRVATQRAGRGGGYGLSLLHLCVDTGDSVFIIALRGGLRQLPVHVRELHSLLVGQIGLGETVGVGL